MRSEARQSASSSRMFSSITAILLMILALLSPGFADTELKPADILARVRPSVVTLVAYDARGAELSHCTGFIATSDGSVVTCLHAVAGVSRVKAFRCDGVSWTASGLLAWDTGRDIAILKIPGANLTAIPLAAINKVQQGDRVLMVGSCLGAEPTASDGVVRPMAAVSYPEIVQITAAISPESTGSPVLNMKGQVIGIADFMPVEGRNQNFAQTVDEIVRGLPKAKRVRPFSRVSLHGDEVEAGNCFRRAWLEMPTDDGPDVKAKYERALSYFEQAITAHPTYQSYFGKALCLCLLDRNKESVDSCKRSVELNREYAPAYCLMGSAHCFLHQYKAAVDDYKKTAKLIPEYELAYGRMGLAYYSLGRYNDAVDCYKKGTSLNPDYVQAHKNLGVAYNALRQYNDAVVHLKQAIALRPSYVEAHYNLGVAYNGLGRYNEAVDCYKEAIKLKPDDANAHYDLGVVYLSMKDKDRAMDEYKTLKTLDADKAGSLYKAIYP